MKLLLTFIICLSLTATAQQSTRLLDASRNLYDSTQIARMVKAINTANVPASGVDVSTLYIGNHPVRRDSLFINGKWRHNVIEGEHLQQFMSVANIDTMMEERLWIDKHLSLWKRYKSDCYADSTGHKGFWFWRVSTGLHQDGIAPAYHPDAWWRDWDSMGKMLEQAYETKATYMYTHRNPTFEGFVDWLERLRR